MTTKTARVYTLDELKEKCQKALADPKLVEIVKTAPWNKDGEVNLSWVYKEAEKYVHEQTKDLQKTKELAVSTRFLGMIRRISQEEFDKLVAQEKQPGLEVKTTDRKKLFHEMEFELPYGTQIITKELSGTSLYGKDFALQFCHSIHNVDRVANFCLEILNGILEDSSYLDERSQQTKEKLGQALIQLLEEKFGLKIKVCGNCKFYHGMGISNGVDAILCYATPHLREDGRSLVKYMFNSCQAWTSKEVSEKKEN